MLMVGWLLMIVAVWWLKAEHWTEVAAAQHEGGRTYELHTLIGFFCTKFEIKRNYKLMKLMIHNLITNYVIKLGINSIKLYVSFQYVIQYICLYEHQHKHSSRVCALKMSGTELLWSSLADHYTYTHSKIPQTWYMKKLLTNGTDLMYK